MPLGQHGKTTTYEAAEVIALTALAFLASDDRRLGRFLDLTGLSPQQLKRSASEASTLQAVLEYLSADEPLLLVFATEAALSPEEIQSALHTLMAGQGKTLVNDGC